MKQTGKVVPQFIAALLVLGALAFGTRQAVASARTTQLGCAGFPGSPTCSVDADCASYCRANYPNSTPYCDHLQSPPCCECLF